MAQRRIRQQVSAFTIFEVTVVLAILGVLMTIISVALNRFNEQLKVNSEIHAELNQWMLVRANLWKEYYASDSLDFSNGEAIIYQKQRIIRYSSRDGLLLRNEFPKMGGVPAEWKEMGVEIEGIREEVTEAGRYIIFSFPWKGDLMELRYYCNGDNRALVNEYFEQLNE